MTTTTDRIALIIGTDYTGTAWETYQSENSARKFEEICKTKLNLPSSAIRTLYGSQVNRETLLNEIKLLANESAQRRIIYYAGHGNNCSCRGYKKPGNGNTDIDDDYQLLDGVITDEDMTQIFQEGSGNGLVIAFSDCCSSGTRFDWIPEERFSWISYGSANDYEDTIQSGDLNALTMVLSEIVELPDFAAMTAAQAATILEEKLRESFIGDLEHITVKVSSESLWGNAWI